MPKKTELPKQILAKMTPDAHKTLKKYENNSQTLGEKMKALKTIQLQELEQLYCGQGYGAKEIGDIYHELEEY